MIVIDSDNYAASGIETFFFPGGEPHARLPKSLVSSNEDILLFLKLRTWNDVGLSLAVKDALMRSQHAEAQYEFIPYFPGARQDRTDGLTPLTVERMAHILGVMHGGAWTFDPHSRVTQKVCNDELHVLMPTDLDVSLKDDIAGIIAPDQGAVARASAFRDHFYPDADLIDCVKSRDFATGKFNGFTMAELFAKGRYIIVDDICDGGGTFNLLAEAFHRDPLATSCRLELFVSHGIFSKGLDAIDPRIEHITTTNSWCRLPESKRLSVLKLEQLFPRIQGDIRA